MRLRHRLTVHDMPHKSFDDNYQKYPTSNSKFNDSYDFIKNDKTTKNIHFSNHGLTELNAFIKSAESTHKDIKNIIISFPMKTKNAKNKIDSKTRAQLFQLGFVHQGISNSKNYSLLFSKEPITDQRYHSF
jgi:hypothetical protein